MLKFDKRFTIAEAPELLPDIQERLRMLRGNGHAPVPAGAPSLHIAALPKHIYEMGEDDIASGTRSTTVLPGDARFESDCRGASGFAV